MVMLATAVIGATGHVLGTQAARRGLAVQQVGAALDGGQRAFQVMGDRAQQELALGLDPPPLDHIAGRLQHVLPPTLGHQPQARPHGELAAIAGLMAELTVPPLVPLQDRHEGRRHLLRRVPSNAWLERPSVSSAVYPYSFSVPIRVVWSRSVSRISPATRRVVLRVLSG
jgi:hypothetical protein